MRDNPYKDLPPLERRPNGSLYRMTPAQRKQAASLIRRECCCFEDGNCVVLDDGDTCTCPQTVSFSVCCGQLGAKKALIYQFLRAPNRGGWYKVSPTPENGLLTVHKTHYDKYHLYPSAGKGVQLHPAPEFPL